MIIMSVDLGKARTGLALCDKTEFLASPYKVIIEKSPNKLLDKLAEAAKEAKAELIVVGLPKNMDGSEGERAKLARQFAEELARRTGVDIVRQDERLTTAEAEELLAMTGKRRGNTKDRIAAVEAAIILTDYLNQN